MYRGVKEELGKGADVSHDSRKDIKIYTAVALRMSPRVRRPDLVREIKPKEKAPSKGLIGTNGFTRVPRD